MDLFKVYQLFKKKAQYPGLISLIDAVFMDVLEQRGIISREQIYDQAAGGAAEGRASGQRRKPSGLMWRP